MRGFYAGNGMFELENGKGRAAGVQPYYLVGLDSSTSIFRQRIFDYEGFMRDRIICLERTTQLTLCLCVCVQLLD
jgi:hypothetical protein